MVQKKNILLIEDEQDLLTLYELALSKAGYKVYTSANGFEGISKAIEKNIDLILLDLMMPLGDGRDVLSTLRLNPKTKEVPVIIISNLNRDTIDLSQVDDQVIDYWVKADISPKILVERLNHYFSA